jgi:hypothetical protein
MVVYISGVCDAPADSFKGMRVVFPVGYRRIPFYSSAVLLCVKLHIVCVCVCGLVLR